MNCHIRRRSHDPLRLPEPWLPKTRAHHREHRADLLHVRRVMLTVVAWTRQDGWLGGDPATGDLVPLPNVLPMRTLPTRVHEDDFTAALLAVTARGSLENIRAALLALPGVTAAHVQPAGPADIRAYVDGGSDEEIMMCLYRELPIYVVSLGSVRGRIENDGACC